MNTQSVKYLKFTIIKFDTINDYKYQMVTTKIVMMEAVSIMVPGSQTRPSQAL